MVKEREEIDFKFAVSGVCINKPIDALPEGKFALLENIRLERPLEIRSRPRLNLLGSLNPATIDIIHSIISIMDKSNNTMARIVGAGSKLYGSITESGVLNEILSGLSGSPLSFFTFRPDEAIEPYLYVADANKFIKVKTDLSYLEVGLNAPKKAASYLIGKPERKVIDNVTAATIGNWNDGSIAAPTSIDRFVATTILTILYDGAAPNWCSVIPTTFYSAMQEGAIVNLNGTEDVIIESIHRSRLATGIATIQSIKYRTGTTGFCTIHLTVAISELKKDDILLVNGVTYVKVIDVITNADGTNSFTCDSGLTTLSTGQTVSGVDSFRCYTTNPFVATNTIAATVGKAVVGASGISTVRNNTNFDLSQTGSNGRSLSKEDFVHLSLFSTDTSAINEIQFRFYLGDNDNYYLFTITPSFIQSSADRTAQSIAVQQQAIQRNQIIEGYREPTDALLNRLNRFAESDPYGVGYVEQSEILQRLNPDINFNPIIETTLGDNVWSELLISFGQFTRVGSNQAKDWKDVSGIEISIDANAAVDIYFDSIWIGGGFGLDSDRVNDGLPYNWIYRMIEPNSKVSSNWSPPIRNPATILRGKALLKAESSADFPSSYLVEWARFGGALDSVHLIGKKINDGSYFEDSYSDLTVIKLPRVTDFERYKPFAFLDTPKSGICNVVGNKLTVTSGNILNTSYPRGTAITIDGKINSFYTYPDDINNVELEEDMGTLSGVPFRLDEPLLTGQPLPMVSGPYSQGSFGSIYFGAGNNKAAGTIYWLDGNSPDTMDSRNNLEITSPSEPIMAIKVYDGIVFVWTTKRGFYLQPTFDEEGFLIFIAKEIANSRGLLNRNGITVGDDFIYYLTDTGIDRIQGVGNPQSITDSDLSTIFPFNGKYPSNNIVITSDNIVTISPPDWLNALSDIWFYYADRLFYMRYRDLNNHYRTWVYDTRANGWISNDKYRGDRIGAFYGEEREGKFTTLVGLDGKLAEFSINGNYENSAAIKSRFLTSAITPKSTRSNNKFLELVLDRKLGDNGYDKIIYFNNANEPIGPINTSGLVTQNRDLEIYDLSTYPMAQNAALYIAWNMDILTIDNETMFYGLILTYAHYNETISNRPTELDEAGYLGAKRFNGLFIKANTLGITKQLLVYDQDSNLRQTFSFISQDFKVHPLFFANPFISHSAKLVSNDKVEWIPDFYQWMVEKESELNKLPSGWDNAGSIENKIIHGFDLEVDTNGVDVEFQLQGDNEVVLETFTVNTNHRSVVPFALTVLQTSHLLRIVPVSNDWRYYNVLYYVDKEPERVNYWKSQATILDIPDLKHIQKMNLAIASNDDVVLRVIYDDNSTYDNYLILRTFGSYMKVPFYLVAKKSYSFTFEFSSGGEFGLYKRDCEVYVKGKESDGPYIIKNPFGAEHRVAEVPI